MRTHIVDVGVCRRQQDNPNIAWDSIKFDKTLVDMEPEQGVPRYVTVEREAHSDFMVRRGLALIVNHGFAATPGGQKDFMYKVATIAGAVQETCDQSGIIALLRAKDEYRPHIANGIRNASDAYDMFQHELWRFGIIQHSERGWYHMDAEAEHVMMMENIKPDTWIVPGRMKSFAAMGQLAETDVYRAGEATARGNLEKGADQFSTFRGKSVYEVRPYQLDVDGRKVDPLNRTRMIGDFFVVPYYELETYANGQLLHPVGEAGATQVYCCETDRFETFTWKGLMHESGLNESEMFKKIPACALPTDANVDNDQINPRIQHPYGGGAMYPDHGLNDLAKATIQNAVKIGIQNAFKVDVNSSTQFESTWGHGLHTSNLNMTQQHKLMKKAVCEVATKSILECGDETVTEMNTQIHTNADGTMRPMADVAQDLHDIYIRGNETCGPLHSMISDAKELVVSHSGTRLPAGLEGACIKDQTLTAQKVEEVCAKLWLIKTLKINQNLFPQLFCLVQQLEYECDLDTKDAETLWNLLQHMQCKDQSIFKDAVKENQKYNITCEDMLNLKSTDSVVRYLFIICQLFDVPTHMLQKAEIGSTVAQYDMLCIRPFRQYTMGTGILLKKGNDLGNTFRGWADFQLTDNIIAKTHIGHFTFWHASVVTNAKCLFLAEDIFCTNYIGGEGSGVLHWHHIDEFREDPIGTMAKNNASIICLPVPIGTMDAQSKRINMNNPISLSGKLSPMLSGTCTRVHASNVCYHLKASASSYIESLLKLETRFSQDQRTHVSLSNSHNETACLLALKRISAGNVHQHGPLSTKLSEEYAKLFDFGRMNHDVDYDNCNTFETASQLINTMCFHTMQKFRNPANNRWEVTNLNTGHFGENGIYEGVKKIRCGFLDYFLKMDYQKSMAMGGLSI